MKKATTILMGLALAAGVAMAQSKPAAVAASGGDDPIIIKAGQVTVHKSEFEAAVKSLPQEYQTYALGPGKKTFAEDFLRMKLLAAEGLKNGLDKDPDVLAQLGLMRENLVANAQLSRFDKSVQFTDADLQKAYDAKKDDYQQVKARHILIAFKGSPAVQAGKKELTDEEAKAKAEDLRKQLAGGADFAELAKKESDDTGSAARGGDLGSFGHQQMVPEFEKAAFETKPGDLSPVVRTQYGYHIIKVDSRESTPLAQVKSQLEKDLRQKKIQEQIDALKASAKPTFDETYFKAPEPPAPAPAAEAKDGDAAKPAPPPKPVKKPATPPGDKKP
ncbi:MAG TPA: peptidylprolyl isomerase [Thermoanaerobaculia bacterium]|nr:peptidylprolyl isomerase [Thermoanaerobaculia bacterium]